MTRIVRLEEIDGDLVLRVPADLAAELGFVPGDAASVTTSATGLTVERAEERVQRQLKLGREIAERHREALARLAR